jgi:predicted MPP superfamily phosphohydrolase
MSRLLFFGILLAIIAAIEFYVFYALKGTFRSGWGVKAARIGYWIALGATLASITTMLLAFANALPRSNFWLNFIMGLGFVFLIVKIILAAFFLVDDIVRLVQWLVSKSVATVSDQSEPVVMPGRRKFIGQLGLVIAAIPFAGAVYGILKGKYDFTVHRETLRFADLPEAFDGLRIVQISDIHTGSFDSLSGVQAGVDLIDAQKPDIILFTGDLVNNLATEADPYIAMFAALKAPLGKFSVLGNHDYGHYVRWDSKAEEATNHQAVRDQNAHMGFQMLHNQHIRLERGGQNIVLAGVENWGLPPFPQYGDLDKAYAGVGDEEFTVLMSHDPSHWDEKVKAHRKHVHLQLSGHTHGAQFGVEIPGIRFSLAQVRYKQWGGLYSEGNQHLYVNRGFGFLGFPGRVGIWPEVTVIELRRG